MLKFALKNMAIKRAKIILIVLSIVISASVALLAYNISEQVDDGFKSTAAYYDMIIGPSGSSTQLAMNTMFFTEAPLGTISYEYVEELKSDMRINKVVPFTMGDSFNGAKIVGTTPDFLDGKELDEGEMRVSGIDHLLQYPEYSDVGQLQELLGTLEKKEDILNLISKSEQNGVNVVIGSESEVQVMNNSALVFKPIVKDGKTLGAIAVLGPRRMDYAKVLATLEGLTGNIADCIHLKNNLLNEGDPNGRN